MNNPLTLTQSLPVGSYIFLSAEGISATKVPVTSLAEASAALSQHRDRFSYGSSSCKIGHGNVRTATGKFIARVSYNGRVWSNNPLVDQNDTEVL